MRTANSLSWRSIAGYGLGDMANNLVFSMGMIFLLNYYTDVAGISAAAAGTMLMLVRIYDAVVDVVAGRVIDRVPETRWGRFRPYLLWGGLPLMLLNVAVFSVPAFLDDTARLIYAYVTYALLGTAYSFVNIPYGSLASVMTQEPRARSLLSASRTLMAALTIIFLAFVLGPVLRKTSLDSIQSQITHLTLLFALIGTLLYAVCFNTTREVIARRVSQPQWGESLSTLIQNRPLQLLCLIALCMLVGVTSTGATAMYYARYVLGDAGYFPAIILITTLWGVLVSVPLTPLLVGKIGKKGTFILGAAIAAAAHFLLFFMPATNLYAVFACLALAAIGSTLCMIVMWAMESDTVEYGEWKTGMRIEGLNYSLFSLSRKCGQALGGSIPAFLLAAGNYVPNMEIQQASAANAIITSITLAPAIAFTLAILAMTLYPLSDHHFLDMLQEIKNKKHSPQES